MKRQKLKKSLKCTESVLQTAIQLKDNYEEELEYQNERVKPIKTKKNKNKEHMLKVFAVEKELLKMRELIMSTQNIAKIMKSLKNYEANQSKLFLAPKSNNSFFKWRNCKKAVSFRKL